MDEEKFQRWDGSEMGVCLAKFGEDFVKEGDFFSSFLMDQIVIAK